jgi:nucleotide sugar dehydrogenase
LERIAIIGIGRIGLCLALNFERTGYEVLGVDRNRELIRSIGDRTLRTPEPGVVEALAAARSFRAISDAATVPEFNPDLIFIAVDTPTAELGGYDHSRVDAILEELFALGRLRDRTELAIVCTTLPGYCDSQAERAMACGYALSYTPGFVAQGSILRDQQYPDQVLIGEADNLAGDRLESAFRRICRNKPAIHRMSRLSAEIAKLATNCALTMKIAFANAIGDLATTVGAEPGRILAAVGADRRIGEGLLRYGFGYGGPCFPRDNRSLNYFAGRHGCRLFQAEATDEMNRRHLIFQVEEYLRAHGADEPIEFDSVTYKPGTEILDESQPLALAVQLARAGRKVFICESAAVVGQLRARFGGLFEYRIRPAEGSPEVKGMQSSGAD